MLQKYRLYTLFFILTIFGQIFASTGGIIGVISPRLMYDGRPILWQNFDSDSASTSVGFFQGDQYNFFGLMIGDDSSRIYAGLNTAGFAIVFSSNWQESDASEADLIKQALGQCGRLQDFDRLLAATSVSIGSNSSFACMDAFGSLLLYESDSNRIDPSDFKQSPDGFLVRANFHFDGEQTANEEYWRYHRAKELLKTESVKRKLHNHVVVKKVARDLQSIAFQPVDVPFTGDSRNAPFGYVACKNSINQFNTVSCVVIHGVRSGENPDFATMWIVLGEPSSGIAVPLWPATSQVPVECSASALSMNLLFQQQKKSLYDLADMPTFMNTEKLFALRAELDPIENIIFAETRKALSRWRTQSDYHQEMIDFQMTTAAHVVESLSK
jgi:hypothetical protein